MGVGVALWNPEEISLLSRSRSIMPLPTVMIIPPKMGVGVAWWLHEEIPFANSKQMDKAPFS